jgi:hypothetical protein
MKRRALGNPIQRALAAGRQAARDGKLIWSNPYRRRPQHDAWERAFKAERQARAALTTEGDGT